MQDSKSTRRRYKTSWLRRFKAKHRRSQQSPKLEDGSRTRCINENLKGTHGSPINGVRCATCHEVHMRSR